MEVTDGMTHLQPTTPLQPKVDDESEAAVCLQMQARLEEVFTATLEAQFAKHELFLMQYFDVGMTRQRTSGSVRSNFRKKTSTKRKGSKARDAAEGTESLTPFVTPLSGAPLQLRLENRSLDSAPSGKPAAEILNRPTTPRRLHSVDLKHERYLLSVRWIDDLEEQMPTAMGSKGMCLMKFFWEILRRLATVHEPPRTNWLARLVTSQAFEAVTFVAILANSAFAVYTADWRVAHIGQDLPQVFLHVELGFMCFYLAELIIKIAVHGAYFFVNEERGWNIFDFILVTITVTDQVVRILGGGGRTNRFSYLRVLRMLRMARILRVLRVVRFLAALRMMVLSVLGSIVHLYWSFVLLLLVFYMFGLVLVQGTTEYLTEHLDELSYEELDIIYTSFGSMTIAMLSLYKASTGGNDWDAYYTGVVDRMGIPIQFTYLVFIGFMQLAIMNIVTALAVEQGLKLAQPDNEAKALELRKEEFLAKQQLTKLLQSVDLNNSGDITQEEFNLLMENEQMHAQLSVLGLDVSDADLFFRMLRQISETEEVDIDAFVLGFMRLKGHATSLDLQSVAFQSLCIRRQQEDFFDWATERIDGLAKEFQPQHPHHQRDFEI